MLEFWKEQKKFLLNCYYINQVEVKEMKFGQQIKTVPYIVLIIIASVREFGEIDVARKNIETKIC